MSFLLVIYTIFLISLVMMRYRSLLSVIIVIALFFGLTSGILLYGLSIFQDTEIWHIFGKDIARNTFLYLVTVLYVFDCICSVLVIKNYREYKKVNLR